MMGIANVGGLSLGEYAAICRQWNKAHGKSTATAPTDDEFDAAVMAARGA